MPEPSVTGKQAAFVVVFLLASIPLGIGVYRARRWLWRQFHYAPPILQIGAGIALFAVIISLVTGSGGTTRALTWATVVLIVVAAFWGRWRYANSPRLRRWDATWAKVEKALPGNPEEADRLIAEGHEEDDREREELRARATSDVIAARAFLKATERELSEIEASSRRHPETVPVAAKRRARLEADLAWARTVAQREALHN